MGILSRAYNAVRNFFTGGGRGGMATVAELSAAKPNISDTHIQNLILAEEIYRNAPRWLTVAPDNTKLETPLKPSGLGADIAAEIARLVMSRTEIKVHDENINAIFQRHVMQRLCNEFEKGFALGGLIIKPFYSGAKWTHAEDESGNLTDTVLGISGNLKVAFHHVDSFLIDEWDSPLEIKRIRFFSVERQDDKYYTRVEMHHFDEYERTITITNVVFTASGKPNRFKWDNLGDKTVPLTTVTKWARIKAKVVIDNVDGMLFGIYHPPTANNLDNYTPHSISPLVRAKDSLQAYDIVNNAIDWETRNTKATIFISEQMIAKLKENGLLPEDIGKIIIPINARSGDTGKQNIYEVYSPEIRHAGYQRLRDICLRQVEFSFGLSHGLMSDAPGRARTATEINLTMHETLATKENNQAALEIALRQAVYGMQIWLNPSAQTEEIKIEFKWGTPVVVSPQDTLPQLLNMYRADLLPARFVNQMFLGISEDTARQLVKEARGLPLEIDDNDKRLLNNGNGGGYNYRTESAPTDADGNNDGG